MNKFMSKLAAAVGGLAVIAMSGLVAHAATINQAYFQTNATTASGQVASNANFTTGLTSLNLNTNQTINMTVGQFLRFGIGLDIVGNANGVSTAWDTANQNNNGNPAQATDLGLAAANYSVTSSDTAGSLLTPQVGTTAGFSKAALNGAYSFAVPASGVIGDVNGGNVGVSFFLGGGNTPPNVNTAGGIAVSAQFADAINKLFSNLTYLATAPGTVILTPNLLGASTGKFVIDNPGTVDGDGNITQDASYKVVQLTGDTINSLPTLTINIVAAPEPASLGLLGMASMGLLGIRRRRVA